MGRRWLGYLSIAVGRALGQEEEECWKAVHGIQASMAWSTLATNCHSGCSPRQPVPPRFFAGQKSRDVSYEQLLDTRPEADQRFAVKPCRGAQAACHRRVNKRSRSQGALSDCVLSLGRTAGTAGWFPSRVVGVHGGFPCGWMAVAPLLWLLWRTFGAGMALSIRRGGVSCELVSNAQSNRGEGKWVDGDWVDEGGGGWVDRGGGGRFLVLGSRLSYGSSLHAARSEPWSPPKASLGTSHHGLDLASICAQSSAGLCLVPVRLLLDTLFG